MLPVPPPPRLCPLSCDFVSRDHGSHGLNDERIEWNRPTACGMQFNQTATIKYINVVVVVVSVVVAAAVDFALFEIISIYVLYTHNIMRYVFQSDRIRSTKSSTAQMHSSRHASVCMRVFATATYFFHPKMLLCVCVAVSVRIQCEHTHFIRLHGSHLWICMCVGSFSCTLRCRRAAFCWYVHNRPCVKPCAYWKTQQLTNNQQQQQQQQKEEKLVSWCERKKRVLSAVRLTVHFFLLVLFFYVWFLICLPFHRSFVRSFIHSCFKNTLILVNTHTHMWCAQRIRTAKQRTERYMCVRV